MCLGGLGYVLVLVNAQMRQLNRCCAVVFFSLCNPQIHHANHQTSEDQRVNVAKYRLNSKNERHRGNSFIYSDGVLIAILLKS